MPLPLNRAAANTVYSSVVGGNNSTAMNHNNNNSGTNNSSASTPNRHHNSSGSLFIQAKQVLFASFLELIVASSQAAFAPCGTLGPAEMVEALLEVMHYSKGAEKLAAAKGYAGQARKLVLTERVMNSQQQQQQQLQGDRRQPQPAAALSGSSSSVGNPNNSNNTSSSRNDATHDGSMVVSGGSTRVQTQVSADGWMYSTTTYTPHQVPFHSSSSSTTSFRDSPAGNSALNLSSSSASRNISSNPINSSNIHNNTTLLESLSSFSGLPQPVKIASARVTRAAAEEGQVTGRPKINRSSEVLSRSVPMLMTWQSEKERRIEEQRAMAMLDEV